MWHDLTFVPSHLLALHSSSSKAATAAALLLPLLLLPAKSPRILSTNHLLINMLDGAMFLQH
jgi:hypothetical protein